ncbi:MAG: DUF2127 domain-containing protein [Acidobacteriaceae bacterium]
MQSAPVPESGHAPQEKMRSRASHKHARGLLLIGLLKLGKSLLFFLIGVGAVKLLHQHVSDVLMQMAMHLRFDTESRFVALLLEKASLIDDHRLRQISFATFSYSALALIEGVGLLLEKTWAEYVTLTLSVAFLPWETYELLVRLTFWKVSITLTNIVIVLYLLWILKAKRLEKESQQGQETAPPEEVKITTP